MSDPREKLIRWFDAIAMHAPPGSAFWRPYGGYRFSSVQDFAKLVDAVYQAGAAAEREACAQIADQFQIEADKLPAYDAGRTRTAFDIAWSIRARGEGTEGSTRRTPVEGVPCFVCRRWYGSCICGT